MVKNARFYILHIENKLKQLLNMKLTQEEIKIKTALIRRSLIDKFYNKEVDLKILEECEMELIEQDEPENYHQANAVRQAINYIKSN